MGDAIGKVTIDLPYEAKVIIRKCTNRGLILNRKGQVFEMRPDRIYKITEEGEVLSQKTHEKRVGEDDV